ncbi:Tansporter [Mycena kentingensis (nom. inval.)]|nr:Tansporter [Mycena kentingensis (nom. inval.)]
MSYHQPMQTDVDSSLAYAPRVPVTSTCEGLDILSAVAIRLGPLPLPIPRSATDVSMVDAQESESDYEDDPFEAASNSELDDVAPGASSSRAPLASGSSRANTHRVRGGGKPKGRSTKSGVILIKPPRRPAHSTRVFAATTAKVKSLRSGTRTRRTSAARLADWKNDPVVAEFGCHYAICAACGATRKTDSRNPYYDNLWNKHRDGGCPKPEVVAQLKEGPAHPDWEKLEGDGDGTYVRVSAGGVREQKRYDAARDLAIRPLKKLTRNPAIPEFHFRLDSTRFSTQALVLTIQSISAQHWSLLRQYGSGLRCLQHLSPKILSASTSTDDLPAKTPTSDASDTVLSGVHLSSLFVTLRLVVLPVALDQPALPRIASEFDAFSLEV